MLSWSHKTLCNFCSNRWRKSVRNPHTLFLEFNWFPRQRWLQIVALKVAQSIVAFFLPMIAILPRNTIYQWNVQFNCYWQWMRRTVYFVQLRRKGLFLVKDMQTLPPPSKKAVYIFWSKLLRNVLKQIKIPIFIIWVINDLVHNFQVFLTDQKIIFLCISKDAQCFE